MVVALIVPIAKLGFDLIHENYLISCLVGFVCFVCRSVVGTSLKIQGGGGGGHFIVGHAGGGEGAPPKSGPFFVLKGILGISCSKYIK